VLLPLAIILKYFALGVSCGIQMAELRIMNQVFYHCATIASDDLKIFFS
jgi:hypothetical protein